VADLLRSSGEKALQNQICCSVADPPEGEVIGKEWCSVVAARGTNDVAQPAMFLLDDGENGLAKGAHQLFA
jgi:hypothetical protein